VLTPLDAQLRPDAPKAAAYYARLLEDGCAALNVLGTTGEATSISLVQRMAFMEALAKAGLPLERIMVGTGAAALGDAITLTAHAYACGFAAALVLPPFYYKGVTRAGIVAFYERLADAVRPPNGSLLLYHFPALSGVPFDDELVAQLLAELPQPIGGLKDSANDLGFERSLRERFPQLAVYPSSEEHIAFARENRCAGIISGSVALWPRLGARAWNSGNAGDIARARNLRAQIASTELIASVRKRVAEQTGDPSWQRCLPPLRA